MRIVWFVVVIAVFAIRQSYGWTEAETNAVGHALAELLAISSGTDDMPLSPDDPAANESIDEPYPTFESLFVGDLPSAVGWSAPEKRAAFFHYLGTITNMVLDGVFTGNVWHADAALGFCRVKGDSSILPYALGILVSTNMPPSLEMEPCLIFKRFATPSMQMNSLVERIVSNTNCLKGAHSRRAIYDSYCDKLRQAFDAGQINVVTNGVAILYSHLANHHGACSLDALLMKTYPTYLSSSNRLSVALRALATDPQERWSRGRVANITNQLLNAAQPLPVVDGL